MHISRIMETNLKDATNPLGSRGMGSWASEAFNAPGNLLQLWFPSLLPGVDTDLQQAVLESRGAPAPQTEAKITDWTPEDLWESQAQRGQVSSALLAASGSQSPSSPPVACQWYESFAPSDGSCRFGSVALFLAAGGGLVAMLLLRRT